MRDDFDPVVADRFKVLDDVRVPDTWSRVQLKIHEHQSVQAEGDATGLDGRHFEVPLDELTTSDPEVMTRPRTSPKPHLRSVTLIAAAAVVLLVAVFVVLSRRGARESHRADSPPVGSGLIAFADGDVARDLTDYEQSFGPADIYVVAPDGGGLRALTATPELDEDVPAWSPDGTRLAFARIATVPRSAEIPLIERFATAPCAGGCLVVVDPATGAETMSVDLSSALLDPSAVRLSAVSLSWSPDGKRIVIVLIEGVEGGHGRDTVVVVDLQTRTLTSITDESALAQWSPDGRWLVVQPFGGIPPAFDSSLMLVPAEMADTGGPLDVLAVPGRRRLSAPNGVEYNDLGGWTPDGSALIVGSSQIDVVPIDGDERRTVIEDGSQPAISPDGSRIAYLRHPPAASAPSEIWVAAADGTDPRRVTTTLTPPIWSPDGRALLAIDEQGWFTVLPDGTGRTMIAPSLSPDLAPHDIASGEIEPRFLPWGRFIPLSWQPVPAG
jgi:hypothetical protein